MGDNTLTSLKELVFWCISPLTIDPPVDKYYVVNMASSAMRMDITMMAVMIVVVVVVVVFLHLMFICSP